MCVIALRGPRGSEFVRKGIEALKISVKFLGYLARLAGVRETTVETDDGATILDVLVTAAARFGPGFASSVFRAPGEVHTHLRVFVDEREAGVADTLASGDADAAELAVLVIPGFEGGSR